MSLRWLPIADKRNYFEVFLLFHNGLNGRAPDYLSEKFTCRQPHHDKNTR